MTTSLLLVDDHAAIAQALASVLRAAGFDPVSVVPPEHLDVDGVLAVARRDAPDVALVDLNMGSGRSGLSLIGPLVGAGVRVVAFTAHDDDLSRAYCFEAGAAGFLSKTEPFDTITDYIVRVSRGDVVVSQSERGDLLALARATRAAGDERVYRFQTLSPRERHVLSAMLLGRSAKEIAADQAVAVKTVRSQIESIRSKLDVHTQLAAVALAREIGWIPD